MIWAQRKEHLKNINHPFNLAGGFQYQFFIPVQNPPKHIQKLLTKLTLEWELKIYVVILVNNAFRAANALSQIIYLNNFKKFVNSLIFILNEQQRHIVISVFANWNSG